MGNGQRGAFTPDKDLGPSSHWNRSEQPDYEAVIDGVVKPGTVSAVFGNASDATECLQEIIEADFGISGNISTSVENAKEAAHKCDISRDRINIIMYFNISSDNSIWSIHHYIIAISSWDLPAAILSVINDPENSDNIPVW